MEQTHRKMLPEIFLQKIIYLEKIEDTEIFVKNILLGDDAFFFFYLKIRLVGRWKYKIFKTISQPKNIA